MATLPSAPPVSSRRWPLFLIGVVLFVAGPILFIVQFQMKYLTMPWYTPILASLGALCMTLSVWQRPGFLRGVGLFVFVLICAFEWFMVLVAIRTPDYQGPAKVGSRLPPFETTLADGKAFTNHDLENGKPALLLFFRGRW